ncbi:MAG TPA: ATPase [Sphingomicrobium sp.]|nr:ATPase [Sphingomicrobium sp.]
MPQITQLPAIFWSQLFWLLLIFGTIFFVIGRGMVPKIQGTVELRDKKIAEDLAKAQAAREEAERTEAEYRQRIEASRAEAMKLAQAAKQAGAREVEERTRAVDAEIGKTLTKAEDKIRKSLDKAMAEIDSVAVEVTRELVSKLTGKTVSAQEATRAVKAVSNG